MYPYEPLSKAVRLLATRGYSHSLVVSDSGILVGVVSVKDIARRILEAFEAAGAVEKLNLKQVLAEHVMSVMSRPPITSRERIDMCKAAYIMLKKRVGILPVTFDDGRLAGAYSELCFGLELLDEESKAISFASSSVVYGEADEPVIEALGRMLEYGFRRLPLAVGEDILIVTMHNILLTLVRNPTAEELLKPVKLLATPAIVLGEDATLANVAEAILATTDRAILIRGEKNMYILTERDIMRAYHSLRCKT